jgi:hypothetical protein
MLGRLFAGAGLILLPFIFSFSEPEHIRLPKAKFLFLMVAAYCAIGLMRKVNPMLGLAYLGCVISAYFSNTVFPFEELLIFTAAIATSYWVTKPSDKELNAGLSILEWVGIVCAVYGILQVNGLDPIQSYQSWADIRPVVFLGQHTLYGPFAVACFTVALFRKHWLRSAILVVPVVLVDSSFTFLSLAVVLAIWAYVNLAKRYFFLLFASGLIAAVMILALPKEMLGDKFNDKGRFLLWGQALKLTETRPFFGYGFGSFRVIYPVFQSKELRVANGIDDEKLSAEAKKFIARSEAIRMESGLFYSPHNEYIQAYFEMGLVGVFILLGLFLSFLISFYASPKTTETWILFAIFWSFAANSIGNFTPHLVPQGLLLLWVYVSMTTRNPPAILFWYVRSKAKRVVQIQKRCF